MTSVPTEPVDHEWVRARLGAWSSGLLDEEPGRRLESHLAGCMACREASSTLFDPESVEPGDHVPPHLLARWDREAPRMSGELRRLVARHIERCPSCQGELRVLGHDPARVVPRDPVRLHPRVQGPMVAWLATAAAIAVVFALTLAPRREPEPPPDGGRAQPGTRPVPESAPAVPATPGARASVPPVLPLMALAPETPGAVELPGSYRGVSDAPPPPVRFDPGANTLELRLPRALAATLGHRVEIAVLDSNSTVLRRMTTTLDDLFAAGSRLSLVIRQGEPAMNPGQHVLRIRVWDRARAEPEELRYAFEVR